MSVAAHALRDDELDAAHAELAAALGREPRAPETFRLHRRADGTIAMTVYSTPVPRRDLGEHDQQPWRHPGAFDMRTGAIAKRARSLPIAEAVPLILDPDGDDAEVARRERLWADEQRRRREQDAAERARRALEDAAEAQRRREEKRAAEQYRADDWYRLPLLARALYRAALAADDGAPLGPELRRIALEVERGSVLFPGRKWWP